MIYSLVKIKRPFCEVEKVSSVEIYQLDGTGARLARICGSTDTPSSRPCVRPAGYRTKHVGEGYCWLHETSGAASTWDMILANSTNPTLQRYLRGSVNLSEEQLSKVESDVVMLYALLGVAQDGELLTAERIELSRKLLNEIGKFKDLKSKLDKEMKFEVEAVKEFVNSIFQVIISQVDKAQARRILTQIMEKVIFPFEAKNKFLGDTSSFRHSYAKATGEIIEEIRG